MFGQPSFGGFGQSQAAPAFGSTPSSSPFGGSTAFGSAQPSPFGASTGTGVFGASQPAFGAASTPAFGAPQTQGGMFGSSAFGAKPAGGFAFGGGSTGAAPFGATPQSQPAFGAAASTPAFGSFGASSTPAFGAAASTPAFGAASTPAFGSFGASSSPAFGTPAASSTFGTPGSSPFGASPATPAFGAPAAPQQQNMGSRVAPYQKHQDKDTSSSSSAAATTVYYTSISAMPAYANKSPEELRWEDYQAGVKNASSAPTPTAAAGFGTPAAVAAPAAGGFGFGGASTGGAFGLGQSSPSPFGASSSPAFGASSPSPFGAGGFGSTPAASTPAFGGFGAAASTPATGTGLFGASASQPAGGGFNFGGSSSPAFGAPASSASAFGASSTPSLFGGSTFGASSGGLFGASSTPAFGAATSSPSLFGAASTPAFGTPGSSPFGAATPAQSTGAFGAPSTGFSFGTPGAAAAKPATAGFSFGSAPASGGLFGAPASTGSLFGGSSAPAFGASGGGLFGSTPTSNPASGGSLFGGSAFGAAPATGGLFGAPASAPATGAFGGFGAAPAAGAAAAPVQPATVGQQPYGALQPLPNINVPEHKVGITQRPIRAAVTSMRPSPLLTLRTTTPKFGLGTAANGYNKTGSLSGTVSSGSPYSLSGGTASPAAAGSADGGRSGSPGAALLLPVRDNPHRLFIRTPPPATTPAANGSSFSPAVNRAGGGGAAGVEESTPVRTPATRRTPQQVSPAAETPASHGTAADKPSTQQQQRSAAGASGSKQPAGQSAEKASEKQQRSSGAAAADGDDAPRLGELVNEGYSLEPSARELQDLACKNPAALSRVSGFKIRREGYGSLEWQQPVDVRGLELEGVVQIERGEVSLYLNNTAEKPPIGSGLNCQCKVTLEGVHKKSKGQQQQMDAAAVAAFRKRLARYCSEMGARFIDYKPEGGIWMFEVDHFSRYGLPLDSDSDNDECMVDGDDEGFETPGKATSQEPELTFGGPAYSDDQDMETAAENGDTDVTQQPRQQQQQHPGSDLNAGAAADRHDDDEQQQRDADEMGFGSVPLQHALPALLGHKAGSLMELRGAFFRRGETGEATAADYHSAAAAAGSSVSPMTVDQGSGPVGFGSRYQQQEQRAAVLPEHNWGRQRAALLQQRQQQKQPRVNQQQKQLVLFGGDTHAMQQLQGVASPHTAAAAATVVVPAMQSRELQLQRRQQSSTAAAAAELLPSSVAVGNSGSVVDASLMLGRSFRVGWGPNGVLAIPQNPGLGDGGASLAGPSAGFSVLGVSNSSSGQQRGNQICKAEDLGVPCVELRRLNAVAAVAGGGSSSSSSSSGGSSLAALSADAESDRYEVAAAAAEALKQRVLSSLDLHFQYSDKGGSSSTVAGGDADADAMEFEQQEQQGLPAGGCAVQWRLRVDRSTVAGYVQQLVHGLDAAAAAGSSSSSTLADIAGCGQHSKDLWELLKVLYEYIDGEDDPSGSGNDEALLPAAASDNYAMQQEDTNSSASRRQLAAMQRKANISRWLQRKLKPDVEAALLKLQDTSSSSSGQQQDQNAVLWSLLHLMSGRQVAAAVALAAAVGDARLATLLAAAGQAAAGVGGKHLVTQLKSWARAGMLPSHISTPRRLLLVLLAAAAPAATAAGAAAGGIDGLIEVSTALNLDWSRAFGLWFWYGVPFTEPVAAVTTAFTAALAAAAALPRPVPPHADFSSSSSSKGLKALPPPSQEQQQSLMLCSQQQQQQQQGQVEQDASSVTFAAADTQYAVLQLHARGPYGLGVALLDNNPSSSSSSSSSSVVMTAHGVGSLLSKLLRVAGHSSNPLDYSTAWQLLLVLESLKALPSRIQEYEAVAINIAASLISQLLLLGPAAAPWASFVAFHLPDHSQLGSYYRENALQQLLHLTVQQWSNDPETISMLREDLKLPLRWLHEAQAVWHGYRHDGNLQLLHLIAAGNWQQAHDMACGKVLPVLARVAVISAGQGAAAAADGFVMAARSFLAAAGSSVSEAAAAAAAARDDMQGGSSSEWWENVVSLQEEPAAAVAAAAHVAAMCTAAAGVDVSSDAGEVLQEQSVQNPARVAAISLRALTRVLAVVSGGLGPSWNVGGGVYAAWCGLFLNPKGDLQDPAVAAAAAAATDGSSADGDGASVGEAVGRCLYLSDLLAGVAAASDGGSSSSSSTWWVAPLQRSVQARMTADVGKALVRLGVQGVGGGSTGGGQQQQQHAPLLVPLAAAGFGGGAVRLGGGQGSAQMLAGAAANVAAGMYVV